jgi:hypothetical protein
LACVAEVVLVQGGVAFDDEPPKGTDGVAGEELLGLGRHHHTEETPRVRDASLVEQEHAEGGAVVRSRRVFEL